MRVAHENQDSDHHPARSCLHQDEAPLSVVVEFYNRCLGEVLSTYLRHADPQLDVCHQGDTGSPAEVQIYLTDLPSLDASRHLRYPNAKIIVIDEGLEPHQQQAVFQHPGVCGLIQRNCSQHLLVKAIRCVAAGELWIDRETIKYLLNHRGHGASPKHVHLTRKEQQIVDLVLQGLKNKAIAEEVFLSESTVKVYLSRVFRKYGVKNRCQLMTLLTRPNGFN